MSVRYASIIVLTIAMAAFGWCAIAEDSPEPQSDWETSFATFGSEQGEAALTVRFPEVGARFPLTFGIPLGQVASRDRIALLDATGQALAADFTPLGNWQTQPARWTLVSCVLDGHAGTPEQTLTLRWGTKVPSPPTPLAMTLNDQTVDVVNRHYAMTLTPGGIQAITIGGRTVDIASWRPVLFEQSKDAQGPCALEPEAGQVRILHDGTVHKAVRFVCALSDAVELHQEFRCYADSPFVRCDVRYVNRAAEDVPIAGVAPLSAHLRNVAGARAGLEPGQIVDAPGIHVRQDAFGWSAAAERTPGNPAAVGKGSQDTLGEWLGLYLDNGASFLVVFPHFQEMAAGDPHVTSAYAFSDDALELRHYAPAGPGMDTDVRLREGMARTFTYWLVFAPRQDAEAAFGSAVKAMPYVVYDRAHLTDMGVFQERAVSHLFDEELLDAALYYKRAQVPRPEYIRCSRGADPGPDKSGEGFYEVDLHAGGMVFGETFQYFSPEPSDATLKQYHDEIGIPREHILTGGRCTYRNGDIVLALYQQYLRSGNRTFHDFARIHGQVFADVSVSHADVSNGLGHYYCDWYGNPYVYQRFEGLLLGALVTGNPWWFETAQAMADYCVRAWQDGAPRDGGLKGGFGGVQHRSPYIAKMLLKMCAVTGRNEYADTAIRLAQWIMPIQEPEGWWRDTPNATREYRNSPIFAGYTCMGLWPLYHATHNHTLLDSLIKAVDYHVGMQEDVTGHNPGTFPNSYWYGAHINKDAPLEGNYATTSHWANVIFQAYLATGNLDYFYSANAAWFGVLGHMTPEGGVPLSNSRQGSVWGHVMVESLTDFAAVAEERSLPIVLGCRTLEPVDAFMGKGATYKDGVFTFDLKYKCDAPLPLRVFFPAGKPAQVTLDDGSIAYEFKAADNVARLMLPPTPQYRPARIVMRK